jgi:hypothetical protein
MPTYKFINHETQELFEDFLSINEKDRLLSLNEHIEQVPNGFAIVSSVGSIDSKSDQGFREVMSRIAEGNPNTPHAERYGRRSAREVKVAEAVKKWKNV